MGFVLESAWGLFGTGNTVVISGGVVCGLIVNSMVGGEEILKYWRQLGIVLDCSKAGLKQIRS